MKWTPIDSVPAPRPGMLISSSYRGRKPAVFRVLRVFPAERGDSLFPDRPRFDVARPDAPETKLNFSPLIWDPAAWGSDFTVTVAMPLCPKEAL